MKTRERKAMRVDGLRQVAHVGKGNGGVGCGGCARVLPQLREEDGLAVWPRLPHAKEELCTCVAIINRIRLRLSVNASENKWNKTP